MHICFKLDQPSKTISVRIKPVRLLVLAAAPLNHSHTFQPLYLAGLKLSCLTRQPCVTLLLPLTLQIKETECLEHKTHLKPCSQLPLLEIIQKLLLSIIDRRISKAHVSAHDTAVMIQSDISGK